jgi:hypothetical protein
VSLTGVVISVKRREAQGCNISCSKRWGDGVRQRQLDEAKGGQGCKP